MSSPHGKSDSEWRAVLTPLQYRILRQSGTEAPHTPLPHLPSSPPPTGTFNCVACDTPLYVASTKFNSGCGWPAFYEAVEGNVVRKEDISHGMRRTEIRCAGCGGHLGHVFKGEGFDVPTGERHCVNGIVLKFAKGDEKAKEKEGREGEEKKAKV